MGKTDYKKEIKNGILEHQLKSWKEFGDFVANSKFCPSTCIFRGQANSKLPLKSTWDRMAEQLKKTAIAYLNVKAS